MTHAVTPVPSCLLPRHDPQLVQACERFASLLDLEGLEALERSTKQYLAAQVVTSDGPV